LDTPTSSSCTTRKAFFLFHPALWGVSANNLASPIPSASSFAFRFDSPSFAFPQLCITTPTACGSFSLTPYFSRVTIPRVRTVCPRILSAVLGSSLPLVSWLAAGGVHYDLHAGLYRAVRQSSLPKPGPLAARRSRRFRALPRVRRISPPRSSAAHAPPPLSPALAPARPVQPHHVPAVVSLGVLSVNY